MFVVFIIDVILLVRLFKFGVIYTPKIYWVLFFQPKIVNAFQRVKVDEVEFADQKLQDNSYWAKDGAEVGYGAKAQEVLGQVKGRDFRHEKTKKKRGSYRGGQIDLQSHSIKFNYSDED
ncbi:hypothetical protein RJ639_040925 [Escallonia herrerae]|uniref:Srp40 C-terminal domain-containing protein n=1 Tax=Escallonia herrerae TaxID=1293975 RepID=A0AA89B5P5_9ASTE|nr:hypothetical protein RJ639_040925 [Escallonia herrerae]